MVHMNSSATGCIAWSLSAFYHITTFFETILTNVCPMMFTA